MAEKREYPDSGSIFRNDRKSNDNQPDMTGYVILSPERLKYLVERANAGKEIKMDISAWSKKAKSSGKTFLSLAFKETWEKDAPVQRAMASATSIDDDDLPF